MQPKEIINEGIQNATSILVEPIFQKVLCWIYLIWIPVQQFGLFFYMWPKPYFKETWVILTLIFMYKWFQFYKRLKIVKPAKLEDTVKVFDTLFNKKD